MRRLLLNSAILFLWTGFVFFSCAGGGQKEQSGAGNSPDTTGRNLSSGGNMASGRQTDTVNRGKDTILRYKTEIRHSGPDQARIDSIKNAKTKKKK
jgi:hypothetical protein